MTFTQFSNELKRRMGADMRTIYRLDQLGRESANDAHRDMWESGDMPEIKTANDFGSFCASIGREFVLDNLPMFAEMI